MGCSTEKVASKRRYASKDFPDSLPRLETRLSGREVWLPRPAPPRRTALCEDRTRYGMVMPGLTKLRESTGYKSRAHTRGNRAGSLEEWNFDAGQLACPRDDPPAAATVPTSRVMQLQATGHGFDQDRRAATAEGVRPSMRWLLAKGR